MKVFIIGATGFIGSHLAQQGRTGAGVFESIRGEGSMRGGSNSTLKRVEQLAGHFL